MKAEPLFSLSFILIDPSIHTYIYIHTHPRSRGIKDTQKEGTSAFEQIAFLGKHLRNWTQQKFVFPKIVYGGEGARACFLQRESGDWSRGGEPRPRKLNFAIPGRGRRGAMDGRDARRGGDVERASRVSPREATTVRLRLVRPPPPLIARVYAIRVVVYADDPNNVSRCNSSRRKSRYHAVCPYVNVRQLKDDQTDTRFRNTHPCAAID